MNPSEEAMIKRALECVLNVNKDVQFSSQLVEAAHLLNDVLNFHKQNNPDPGVS